MDLDAKPLGILLNNGYQIQQGQKIIAKAKFDSSGSKGQLIVDQKRYTVVFKGFPLRNTLFLMDGTVKLAQIRTPLMPPRLYLDCKEDGQPCYEYWRTDNTIIVAGQVVGSVKQPGSLGARSILFQLPDTMPTIPRLFMIWAILNCLSYEGN